MFECEGNGRGGGIKAGACEGGGRFGILDGEKAMWGGGWNGPLGGPPGGIMLYMLANGLLPSFNLGIGGMGARIRGGGSRAA